MRINFKIYTNYKDYKTFTILNEETKNKDIYE